MTSDHQIPDPHNDDTRREPGGRPLGFWLKLVDRRLSEEIERALADDALTRREWRLLNLVAGTARDDHLAAKLDARPELVHGLADRGWVEGTPPSLTPTGREALDRLTERVGDVRSRVAGAVSPEDFATTVASLEAMARELGWDESQPLPRGRRGGRGFGRRHHGFGGHGHGHHPEHDRPHGDRFSHEHCAPGAEFRPREHSRFGKTGRPGRPRQDVHVHVHVHGERHGHA